MIVPDAIDSLTLLSSPTVPHQTTTLSNYKLQLKTLKKRIKDYEHQFVYQNGRKPTKEDIENDVSMGNKLFLFSHTFLTSV